MDDTARHGETTRPDVPGRPSPADWRQLLAIVLVVAVPAVAIGNALLVVVNPWFVDAQYALPGFPDSDIGLDNRERSTLAHAGLDSVRPLGPGVAALEDARLPDGTAAFRPEEIAHMADVRNLIGGFMVAWLAGLLAITAAALALVRLGWRDRILPALGRGGLLTIAIPGLAGLVMLADFDYAFTTFHRIFFTAGSWRFGDNDTLLQLYPDMFWGVAAAVTVFLVLLQAGTAVWLRYRFSAAGRSR